MKLKPGCKIEYQKRHAKIWPELLKALKEAGLFDYAIFLDEETNILFAVQKLRENHSADRLREQEIMQKWWDYMSDLMETHPENAPVEVELEEMFYME